MPTRSLRGHRPRVPVIDAPAPQVREMEGVRRIAISTKNSHSQYHFDPVVERNTLRLRWSYANRKKRLSVSQGRSQVVCQFPLVFCECDSEFVSHSRNPDFETGRCSGLTSSQNFRPKFHEHIHHKAIPGFAPSPSSGHLRRLGRCESTEFPLRRNLPDNTVAIGSAVVGGAVEIAFRVKCHVADRLRPVVAASKVVQRGVCPTAT